MSTLRRPLFWLIVLVASQYMVLQLLTSAQYYDAPRNMLWGTFVLEQPRYLLDAENRYDRVNGFPPTPRSLAPAGLANGRSAPLHSWWGPAYLGLFALVWGATGSFTALELVVPIAAGALVVLTYLFGVRFFSERVGVLAALLLAFFPNFREMATIAMVEPISALLLLGALWALLAGRPWLTALLGTCAMLGKIDMLGLYYGMLGASMICCSGWLGRFSFKTAAHGDNPGIEPLVSGIRRLSLGGLGVAAGVPLLAVGPWLVLIYGIFRRPATVGGLPSLDVFLTVLPLMSDQLFTLGRALTLAGIGLLLAFTVLGVVRGAGPTAERRLLGMSVALGLCILLLYAALPGASNNPRVMIPVLPMLLLLVALGAYAAGRRLRVYGLASLVALYLLGNSAGIVYQVLEGRIDQGLRPVWATLRSAPPGTVLTEHYWEAALYARQQATWFEHDPAFQRAILMDVDAFERYLADTPIRYVVLPAAENELALLKLDPTYAIYAQLPFGRDLPWKADLLVAPQVRAFLEARFAHQSVGQYRIYTIER